jgi:hypothetical protein
MIRALRYTAAPVFLLVAVLATTACKTGGQTGALAGGGIGALAGQAISGNSESTLIGAAVGTGIGYIIGNEADKKKARTMSESPKPGAPPPPPPPADVGPLGGTRWQIISLNPLDIAPPYTSKIIEFRPDGRVITTTTKPDGEVEVFDERYRVVGNTLIVNKPGYLINARYSISGQEMIVSAERFSAVLKRL